jgi:phosphoserine aminotransferase
VKKINFYSGPAILPESVLEQAKAAIDDFAGSGLSILEISHRSKPFVAVIENARALVKELMNLEGSNNEVIFLQGGGSTQFYMVPFNLLNENETASYFDTGTWANGAMNEAKLFGNVHVACSSKDSNYTFIPKDYGLPQNPKYLHITSNNTIYGTQLHWWPKANCPIVVDMSSDIFSRDIDYNQFDLIYAGVQKNIGPAGATVVVVNKDILGTVTRKLPKMIDYRVQIEKESMNNTPSVFAVYVSYLTLQWIKKEGIKNIEERNNRKAGKLYTAIDESTVFKGTVAKDDRSLMNVCFRTETAEQEEKFAAYCEQNNIAGIKGHRSVGGFRASIYNAMPESGVDTLIQLMKEFERTQA